MSATSNKLYARRKEGGLCVKCGKPRLDLAKTMCLGCRDKARKSSGARNRKKREQGICPLCNRPGYQPKARAPKQQLIEFPFGANAPREAA